jgi:hypothetical protein
MAEGSAKLPPPDEGALPWEVAPPSKGFWDDEPLPPEEVPVAGVVPEAGHGDRMPPQVEGSPSPPPEGSPLIEMLLPE